MPPAAETAPAPSRSRPRLRAATGAALLTGALFCLAGALAGSHPFGPRTRNIVDLGQQYLPFHVYWRKLLLGDTHGDLFLNWSSGFGANFLGDFGTYLSSPFDLLVLLFPADRPELALYVITAAKIAAAAAGMAALLLTLRRGPWPVAAVLGTAYALSGWTFNYGATVPMWLDGLAAFPLLCLVGEWARRGRRPVLGPLVVALAWFANFYTAYMATIGAAVVLTVRLLTTNPESADPAYGTGFVPRHPRLTALLRAARSVLIGIGLAAPLVVVIFFATRVADPTPPTAFVPADWTDVLARLLPATASVATPALFIGTPALALALTLPFNRAVATRVRAGWTGAIVLVALSLQWKPTHLLWHAGASPNGIPYRQTFVLCGLLLIAAWLSTAQGLPRPAALLCGGALLAGAAWAARGSADIDRWTYPAVAAAGALAVLAAAAALLGARRGGRLLPTLAVLLLLAAQAGETLVTGKRIEEQQLAKVSWAPRLGPWHTDTARAVAEKDAWPRHRTEPGEVPGGNDALLVGGEGADYYSSLTSDTYSRTLAGLGFGYYAKGRHPVGLDNPVTDAVFSVGSRVRSVPEGPLAVDRLPRADVTAADSPVPPLVTVHPADPETPSQGDADSAFARQERLLGHTVYEVPDVRRISTGTSTATGTGAGTSTGTGTGAGKGPGAPLTLTARCPVGSQVWLWAPEYQGTAALDGHPFVSFAGKLPSVLAPMRALGAVPGSGEVRVTLKPEAGSRPTLPARAVGCLVPERLAAAVRQLTATGATAVRTTGHTLTADLPPGSTGTAVLAVPRISGWRCAAGDAPLAPARSRLGLVAVPLDGRATSVTCSFRPPGVKLGGAVGVTALAALLATAWLHRRRRRTREPAGPQEFTARAHEARPAEKSAV
ncbi:YfhO family protein [Streptomyces sp. NPDC048659]|uniref:YfhO family protein n=1 Tax=Streptomyces sp. NPDC048659 TaxID=3155489 RepID=UPI0034172DEF